MPSVFEQRAGKAPEIVDETKAKSPTGAAGVSPFQQRAQVVKKEDESWWKSIARTALQIPQGIAEVTGPGLWAGLWQILALGETELGVDELHRLREIGEREGKPFDEEAYEAARQNALSYIPTVSNIARGVESYTGIPLEPKTRAEKGLRFASSAAKAIPKPNPSAPLGYGVRGTNTALPRPILGAAVEGAREVGIELGVPEPVADIASFGILKSIPQTGNQLRIGAETKPSGMTKRRYEDLEAPFEVPKSKINQINETVENDFRKIADEIIEKSPIKETHQALANDVTFKKNARERFKDVEALAETLPKQFETSQIKSDLQTFVNSKKNKGLTPSEFDKSHNKFIEQFIKETPEGQFTTKEIVAQYRKNNGQLSEAYEPGQSFAYNRAKREALLDYNRALANMIEREFPGSEFANLFKETNAKWAEISNSEAITKFLDTVFKEKINYQKARQLFDKEGMTVPFKKALGEEGFAKFETLLNDLLSTEKGMKYLRAAESQGFTELAKLAGSYLLHPSLAKAKLGLDALKGGYNKIFEMLLDKPSIGITWNRGINAMKKGNFKAAEKEFTKVKAQEAVFDNQEKSRTDALKKFNERKKQKTSAAPTTLEIQPISARQELPPSSPLKKSEVSNNFPAVIPKEKPATPTRKTETLQLENKSTTPKRLEHKPKEVVTSEAQPKNRKDDLRSEIKALKEKRDVIQGKTQESIKQRLPLNEKINLLEEELYKLETNYVNEKRPARRPKSETIEDLQLDIDLANTELARWKKEKYHTDKYKAEQIKKYTDIRQEAHDKISELKNKTSEVKTPQAAVKPVKKQPATIEELHQSADRVHAELMEANKRHGMNFSIEEGEAMIKKFDEFIKLNKEAKKHAIQVKDIEKEALIDTSIKAAENTKKRFNSVLKELKNELEQGNAREALNKKSPFPAGDIRHTMQEIVRLRKLKKSIKGGKGASAQKSKIDREIKDLEDIYHKNKKAADAAAPDLRKYERPNVSKKGLETQKDYIIDAVEKALKNPPATEKIKIEVPGDGTFSVWNIEEVLKDFIKNVEKDWPVKQLPSAMPKAYGKLKS